jgi:hypothetical protein
VPPLLPILRSQQQVRANIDSADADDYGVSRRGKKRGKFDDQHTFAKHDRHVRRLAAANAGDATDGLPDGDRWSTWDQTENLVPNNRRCAVPGAGAS